jgi:cytidine deaminase
MVDTESELIEAARAVVCDLKLREDFSAGGVGAAIRTAQGNIYTGICIDLGSGLGFCAEVAAIAQMLTHRETQIDTVVAVTWDRILPPCGRCRETMAQIDARNLDCTVIVGEGRQVLLRDLLPNHWLAQDDDSKSTAGPNMET